MARWPLVAKWACCLSYLPLPGVAPRLGFMEAAQPTRQEQPTGSQWAILAALGYGVYSLLAGQLVPVPVVGGLLYNPAASIVALMLVLIGFSLWRASWGLEVGLTLAATALVVLASVKGAPPAGDAALVVAAASFGKLIARLFREPNIILPAVMVAATVDLLSVYFGPTGYVVKHMPGLLAAGTTMAGQAGATIGTGAGRIALSPVNVGAGDIVFMGMFLCVAIRLSLDLPATVLALFVAASAGIILAAVQPIPIPGLLLIGAAALIANRGHIKLSGEEQRSVIVLGVVLALLLVWALLR